MYPAGSRSCALCGYNARESHPHTLRKADPKACMTGPEYKGPETGPDRGLRPDGSDLREIKAAEMVRESKDMHGWRRVVRNFTPSYAQLPLIGHLRFLSSITIIARVRPQIISLIARLNHDTLTSYF